jgi:hypothetical protein
MKTKRNHRCCKFMLSFLFLRSRKRLPPKQQGAGYGSLMSSADRPYWFMDFWIFHSRFAQLIGFCTACVRRQTNMPVFALYVPF